METTRICITISVEQYKLLKQLARDKDMKQAALVREALKAHYGI